MISWLKHFLIPLNKRAMKRTYYSFLVLVLLPVFFRAQVLELAKYVNPFVGTDATGHTFPGAVVPFGMVQLSPDTRIDGSWEGCSGYHYSDSLIYGFSHTHLSGTGCSDWGDIMIMPTYNSSIVKPADYAARFSHKNEKATAGFYEVTLNDGIKVELTASERVGFHRYTFPRDGEVNIVMDFNHRDKLLMAKAVIDKEGNSMKGYRRSAAWAVDQQLYYYMEFSRKLPEHSFFPSMISIDKNQNITIENDSVLVWHSIRVKAGEQLLIKVALSPVSEAKAKYNMEKEVKDWNFEKVKATAADKWNRELSKIRVTCDDETDTRIFYTALYHCMLHPSLNMDYDSVYVGRDKKQHKARFSYYHVFSLWDTYRALHPLFTIIDRKRVRDFIHTFLAQYQEGGRLPMWELSCNETDCMIGYHSVSVIADAWAKQIRGYDAKLALQAMKTSANYQKYGLPVFAKNYFLAMDDESESVSKTLEYAYDDWCIATFAKSIKEEQSSKEFLLRSLGWKNVFDPTTGFMRPRQNGDFIKDFDPFQVNNHFTEANAWQYAFYVPHDVNTHIEKMGGDIAFIKKLDELFTASPKTTGRTQADITGLIGQYAHGNEPSHHAAYLYAYAGAPARTQYYVRKIMREFYKDSPDGLIGNEDCGQMSAWYVMSALGLYQVCPGSTDFVVGSPMVKKAIINLGNQRSLNMLAPKNSLSNVFVKSLLLNTKASLRSVLSYNDIVKGGTLTWEMTNDSSGLQFGKESLNRPVSRIVEKEFLCAPLIKSAGRFFEGSQTVSIDALCGTGEMRYTLDGSEPTAQSPLYTGEFKIKENTLVRVAVFDKGRKGSESRARFYKRPNNYSIHISSQCNPQYSAGGQGALLDGIRGELDWRKGDWQGYQGQDFECILDLKSEKEIAKVSCSFLEDTKSWIFFPVKVEIEISNDGKNYSILGTYENKQTSKDGDWRIADFEVKGKKQKARYVRVRAVNYGNLPEWHPGKGNPAFIFIDEITID